MKYCVWSWPIDFMASVLLTAFKFSLALVYQVLQKSRLDVSVISSVVNSKTGVYLEFSKTLRI